MFQKKSQLKPGEKCSQALEDRLAVYYGPALPPHPLPETAWVPVRDQLGSVRRVHWQRRGPRWLGSLHTRGSQVAPARLQEHFAALLAQINYPASSPELRCHFSIRPIQPRVQSSPLGRGYLCLVLPQQNWYALQAIEVEVLLAVGLARCLGASRALFLLARLLLAASLLCAVASFSLVSLDRRFLWGLCLAFACCVGGTCLTLWQERVMAFRGDRQAVQWLGRERVCRGLHALAEHNHSPRRPTWGEPSLAERIARVCGSPTKTKDEHLTLVG